MGLITSANTILGKDDFHYEEIEVPEWGGSLRLKSLSGAERSKIIKITQQQKDTADGVFEQCIIYSAVDGEGRQIFKDDQATLSVLKSKDAGVTQRIGRKVLEISGLSRDSLGIAEKN